MYLQLLTCVNVMVKIAWERLLVSFIFVDAVTLRQTCINSYDKLMLHSDIHVHVHVTTNKSYKMHTKCTCKIIQNVDVQYIIQMYMYMYIYSV